MRRALLLLSVLLLAVAAYASVLEVGSDGTTIVVEMGREDAASRLAGGDSDFPSQLFVLMLATFIGMGVIWLTSYALLVAKVGGLLKRSVVRRVLNAVTGTVLTALGVRLAFERR